MPRVPPLYSSIAAEPVFCVAGPVFYEDIRVFLIALRALFKYGFECFWEVGVQGGGHIVNLSPSNWYASGRMFSSPL